MFKGIRGRIIYHNLFIIVFFMLALVIGLMWPLEKYFITNLKDSMINQSRLISDMIEDQVVANDFDNLDEKVKSLSYKINTRVTIVLLDGKVIADSEVNPQMMENHGDRPEVQEALSGVVGSETRFSATLATDMMYVALPLKSGEKIIGATRLAIPLSDLDKVFLKLKLILVTGILIVALIVFILSLKLVRGLTQPIEAISEGAKRIAAGNLDTKVYSGTKDEIGELGKTINSMTTILKEKIDEISQGKSSLENILNTIASGVIMLDNYGLVKIINPAAEEIFGVISSTYKDKHNLEVIRNFGLNEQIERCLIQEIIINYEFNILYPEEKVLQCYIAPIYRDDKIAGVTMVFHDITNIRKLDQMRADFVANASHELRTPLTVIKGYAETLLNGALDDSLISKKFVTIIDKEAERLKRLVDELLTLSQIESNQKDYCEEKVDIRNIIKSICQEVKPRYLAKDISLSMDLPEQLGMIQVNPDQIKQVLVNLIDNAIKYTPNEGHVFIKVFEEGDNIKVTISDTGIGIPEKDISRIFERFYRVDKARTRQLGGFGLGLSIVKNIIESYGGNISVESIVDKGSTFSFTLPMAII